MKLRIRRRFGQLVIASTVAAAIGKFIKHFAQISFQSPPSVAPMEASSVAVLRVGTEHA